MATALVYDFITLLAVVNPIEAAATFATLTGGFSPRQQARIALRSSIVALIILVVFGYVGEGLLSALGIGFPAFRIAGGLLLLRVGFNMVFAKDTGAQKLSPEEQAQTAITEDPTVFPLAIPIITGPGALTTIVTLMSKRNESGARVAARHRDRRRRTRDHVRHDARVARAHESPRHDRRQRDRPRDGHHRRGNRDPAHHRRPATGFPGSERG